MTTLVGKQFVIQKTDDGQYLSHAEFDGKSMEPVWTPDKSKAMRETDIKTMNEFCEVMKLQGGYPVHVVAL
jgi:hypothetical protein